MFYDFSVPIPANTPESAPVLVTAALTAGVIHRLEIEFPAGCAGLVHVAIRQAIHQLWPGNDAGSFSSDDHVIAFDEHYVLEQPPLELELVGWNLDDTYAHTIPVRIGVLPPEVSGAAQQSTGLLQRLLKVIGG